MRGGSWNNDNTNNLRCANRNRNNPDNRNNNNGFRVASALNTPRSNGGFPAASGSVPGKKLEQ